MSCKRTQQRPDPNLPELLVQRAVLDIDDFAISIVWECNSLANGRERRAEEPLLHHFVVFKSLAADTAALEKLQELVS
jgi:hypothetical protein